MNRIILYRNMYISMTLCSSYLLDSVIFTAVCYSTIQVFDTNYPFYLWWVCFISRFTVFKFWLYFILFLKILFTLFLDRRKGRERERDRNINVWLPLTHPLLGTWPTTQACALTGNQTSDPLVHRPVLNPLSHTSQGYILLIVLLQLSQFFPFAPPPSDIATPLFMSMGPAYKFLDYSFPILYFTSPWLFCSYLFALLNPLTSSPIRALPPIWQPSKTPHTYDSVSVLVCLVCFLDSVVDRYVFIAIFCS